MHESNQMVRIKNQTTDYSYHARFFETILLVSKFNWQLVHTNSSLTFLSSISSYGFASSQISIIDQNAYVTNSLGESNIGANLGTISSYTINSGLLSYMNIYTYADYCPYSFFVCGK